MRRVTILLAFCLCVVSVGTAQQVGSNPNVYDDFSGKWLDAAKWQPTNALCWGNVLECVREIRSGKLHLIVRSFGNFDSDSGGNWSENALPFANPSAVTSITANVTVRDYSGIGCSTNSTDFSGTQVRIGGNFFNTGSGLWYDDVQAWVIVGVDAGSSSMFVGAW